MDVLEYKNREVTPLKELPPEEIRKINIYKLGEAVSEACRFGCNSHVEWGITKDGEFVIIT